MLEILSRDKTESDFFVRACLENLFGSFTADVACSRLSVVGGERKKQAKEKTRGRLRRAKVYEAYFLLLSKRLNIRKISKTVTSKMELI